MRVEFYLSTEVTRLLAELAVSWRPSRYVMVLVDTDIGPTEELEAGGMEEK